MQFFTIYCHSSLYHGFFQGNFRGSRRQMSNFEIKYLNARMLEIMHCVLVIIKRMQFREAFHSPPGFKKARLTITNSNEKKIAQRCFQLVLTRNCLLILRKGIRSFVSGIFLSFKVRVVLCQNGHFQTLKTIKRYLFSDNYLH